MTDSKKLAKATTWSMFAEIASKLIAPITNMILARILLPEAFGAVATITMVISFADVFTDAGFQKYIVQHEFENKEEYIKSVNVAFWSNFILSALAVFIITFFRKNLAALVGSPDLAIGMAVASGSILVSSFSSIQMAVYKRAFDFKTLFTVRIVTSAVPLFVTVPLALVFRDYWALVIGTLVMNLIQAIMLSVKSEWKPKFYYSFNKFREMFSFTSWTLLESISIWLTSYIGTFIVGRTLNDYYLGLYKTSMTTVNAYMSIVTSSIIPVLFSALSRYQNDETQFRATYFKFQSFTADCVMPMGIGLYVFRDLATKILLGANWTEAAEFIGLWSLMSSVTIIYSFFSSEVYRSKGKPNISLLSQLIHLAVLIPVISISADYGYKTLYIARSLVRIQAILTSFIIMSAIFKIRFTDNIKNTYPQIISALIMGSAAYLLKGISDNIIWQFTVIAISAVLYFVLLMLFKQTREDILKVAGFCRGIINENIRRNTFRKEENNADVL